MFHAFRRPRRLTSRGRPALEGLESRVQLCAAPAAYDVLPSHVPAGPAPGADASITGASTTGGSTAGVAVAGISVGGVAVAAVAGLPALSSLPGSHNYLFLDFDGAEGSFQVHATPPFTQDADLTTFNASEQAAIREIWEGVAEIYSPFNLNVTTVEPPRTHFSTTARIIIGGDGAWAGPDAPLGLGHIHGFGNGAPGYVFSGMNAMASFPGILVNTAAHEAGHALGLMHQSLWAGNSFIDEYRPRVLMGAYHGGWSFGPTSRGPSGDGLQDDIRGIAEGDAVNHTNFGYPGVGYRPGDAPDSHSAAAPLAVTGGRFSSAGVIQYHTDQDWHAVTLPAGPHHADVSVSDVSFLDARLEVRDASGNLVAVSDPSHTTHATVAFTAPAAGTYRIGVMGAREFGQPGGATTYAHVGSYTLAGGAGAADRFEPNDNDLDPFYVGAVGRVVEGDLSIHAPGDADYFMVIAVAPGTLTVETATDPAAGDVDLAIVDGTRVLATGAPTATPGVERATLRVELGGGQYKGYTVRVTGANGAAVPRYSLSFSNPTQRPWWGLTNAIGPGAAPLRAGNYDIGGEGVAYHDTTRTHDQHNAQRFWEGPRVVPLDGQPERRVLIDTRAGEWVEYTVDVLAAGTYDLTVHAASHAGGGRFHLELDGVDVTGPMDVPDTNDVLGMGAVTRRGIALPAGSHVLRLVIDREAGTSPFGAGAFEFIRFTPATTPRPDDPAYQQDTTADAIVSIEAEVNDGNLSRNGKTWSRVTSTVYASGAAMQATPNTGTQVSNASAATTAPQLSYRVNFLRAGTHYLWVRGASATSADDSLHAGLDGVVQGTADDLAVSRAPGWKNTDIGGAVARITVPSPGVHTVDLWMREDGVIVDKLVLTTRATYVPAGAGPAPSPRTGEQPPPNLEAETATLNGVVVARSHAGYTGTGYADFTNATGDFIEWNASPGAAGDYVLTFRYANGSTSPRPLELTVNGRVVRSALRFPSTGAWNVWRTVSVTVPLSAGTPHVRLNTIGFNGANIDSLTVAPAAATPQVFQAEDATLFGADRSSSNGGYTGSGYVDYGASAGEWVEFVLEAAQAGTRTVRFRYANGSSSNRPLELRVNGSVLTMPFAPTGSWATWREASALVQLVAGTNRIRLTSIGPGPNIDAMTLV